MRFLSDAWFDAMAEALAGLDVPADLEVAITQVVTDAPGGPQRWTLRCAAGRCHLERGESAAETSSTTLHSDTATALAIATGELPAGRAILHGHLRITGDPLSLVAATPLLDAIRPALATVGSRLDR